MENTGLQPPKLSRAASLFRKERVDGQVYELIAFKDGCAKLPQNITPLFCDLQDDTVERKGQRFALLKNSKTRTLSYILEKNPALEESYLALIIKLVIEIMQKLHASNLFGINFHTDNLVVRNCGKLCVKNPFTLKNDKRLEKEDFEELKRFSRSMANLPRFEEREICVSRNFRDFLALLDKNQEPCFLPDILQKLMESKFLSRKGPMLSDLLDGDEESTDLMNQSLSAQLASQDAMECSSGSNLVQQEIRKDALISAAESLRVQKITSEVFEKYWPVLTKNNGNKVLQVVKGIESAMLQAEQKKPGVILKIIKRYLNNLRD